MFTFLRDVKFFGPAYVESAFWANWSDSDSVAWARRTLSLLLVESGR